MKNTIITLLCGLALFTSCKKNKSTAPDPVIPAGIYATINGSAWTGGSLSITSVTGGPNFLEVSGSDSLNRTIDLRINNFLTKGSFNVPQKNDSIYYSNDFGVPDSSIAATSGNITIQVVNDTAVGGTFSFKTAAVTVTNGTFYVKY